MKKHVEHYGIKALGRRELIKYHERGRLTPKQAALGKCYDCMGGYTDGKYSCMIPDCTLYPFMPYREVEKLTAGHVGFRFLDYVGSRFRGLQQFQGLTQG